MGVTHFNAAPTVNTLLCAHPAAEKLSRPVRATVAAFPPTTKLFADMVALNLIPVHVCGLTETYGRITRTLYPIDTPFPPAKCTRRWHARATASPPARCAA